MSTAELSVLMVFNKTVGCTYRCLLKATGLSDSELKSSLLALTTAPHNVLLYKSSGGAAKNCFSDLDRFSLNDSFSSHGVKKMTVRSTAVLEDKSAVAARSISIQGAFIDLVDSAIMRFLKRDRTVEMRSLQSLVMQHCASRVAISFEVIRERIRRLCRDGLLIISETGDKVHFDQSGQSAFALPAQALSVSDTTGRAIHDHTPMIIADNNISSHVNEPAASARIKIDVLGGPTANAVSPNPAISIPLVEGSFASFASSPNAPAFGQLERIQSVRADVAWKLLDPCTNNGDKALRAMVGLPSEDALTFCSRDFLIHQLGEISSCIAEALNISKSAAISLLSDNRAGWNIR